MATKRPPRLPRDCYLGPNRYSLTICAFERRPIVANPACYEPVLTQLLPSARRCEFAVITCCCIPDHLHLLVEGLSPNSDPEAFVKDFKQRTGFIHRRSTGQPLWQEGFYDRVLREGEDVEEAVRYVLGDPVRARLVRHPLE